MEGAWQMMTELSNIYFDVCFSKVYLSSTIIKIKFHIFFCVMKMSEQSMVNDACKYSWQW